MNLWHSIGGMVTLRITSADVAGFLEQGNRKGIAYFRVNWQDELTVTVTVSRKNGKKLIHLGEKQGTSCEIVDKNGLFWQIAALRNRPVLVIGLLFFLLLTAILPTRVLFVRVEGNASVPARQILAAAESCGIRFGAERREVRSEKVKNALLDALPQLQWAGVNTSGCVATISVRERPDPSRDGEEEGVSSIVACLDGVILSCTAEAGSLQCFPGQAVQSGQVLISGYTDCGLLIRAEKAEGEVFALTRQEIRAVTPMSKGVRVDKEKEEKYYSLILGKKRINFNNGSGICDTTCGRMYAEYYIYLPGGFRLPLALAVETHSCWNTSQIQRTREEVEKPLSAFLKDSVGARMISGEILSSGEQLRALNGVFRLEGNYLCREMIGRSRQEGKVESDGKSG